MIFIYLFKITEGAVASRGSPARFCAVSLPPKLVSKKPSFYPIIPEALLHLHGGRVHWLLFDPALPHRDLTLNYLNGTIPRELGSLARLQNVYSFPPCLSLFLCSRWWSLWYFFLSFFPPFSCSSLLGNRLTGQIPKEIGNISTLQSL